MRGNQDVKPVIERVSEEMLDQYIAKEKHDEFVSRLFRIFITTVLILLGVIKLLELLFQTSFDV